jgi:hypothetical protein
VILLAERMGRGDNHQRLTARPTSEHQNQLGSELLPNNDRNLSFMITKFNRYEFAVSLRGKAYHRTL